MPGTERKCEMRFECLAQLRLTLEVLVEGLDGAFLPSGGGTREVV